MISILMIARLSNVTTAQGRTLVSLKPKKMKDGSRVTRAASTDRGQKSRGAGKTKWREEKLVPNIVVGLYLHPCGLGIMWKPSLTMKLMR